MKRFVSIAFASACALYSHVAMAQQDIDTVKVQQVDEVVVKAVRASKNAPFAVAAQAWATLMCACVALLPAASTLHLTACR